MKIAKNIIRKCTISRDDIHLALLNYSNTPPEGTEYLEEDQFQSTG